MSEKSAEERSGEPSAKASAGPVLFDAVLHPHTSLSPRGFFLLMAALGFISFCAGIMFVIAGAWPVFGFFGLDILLVYAAFKLNYRDARRYETVRLTRDWLMVEKISPTGRRARYRFQPYWLKIEIDEDRKGGRSLTLRSHGKTLELGAFLSPDEKSDLATALSRELRRLQAQIEPEQAGEQIS